jgi:hypothetical protein
VKSMNMLQSICGVKKSDVKETDILDKLSNIKKTEGNKNKMFSGLDDAVKESVEVVVEPPKEPPKKGLKSLRDFL